MDDATARALIQAHFDASNVGAPGGGPHDEIARASEIYAEDAVVEWPQSGERLRGRENDDPVIAVGIMEFRGDKVVRERIFFGEPFEPPAWRAGWVELFDPTNP